MKSHLLTIAICVVPTLASAQADDPNHWFPETVQTPVPLYSSDFCFTQHHASTAAEGYLRGYAAWIHARGNFLVNERQAAILHQYVRHLELLNKYSRAEWNDWQRLRRERRVEAKREENLSSRVERFRAAYELTATELDRSTGVIHWPAALQAPAYELHRQRLEELYCRQTGYDCPTPSDARAIQVECDRLIRESSRDQAKIASSDHRAAQRFLRGLKYEPLFR